MATFIGLIMNSKCQQTLINLVVLPMPPFPETDDIKAIDLTWSHYLRPFVPIKINGWFSDSDLHGNDAGASIGIEIPLDKRVFHY